MFVSTCRARSRAHLCAVALAGLFVSACMLPTDGDITEGDEDLEQLEDQALACSAATNWTAGTFYPVGALVRYNGSYYVAVHENPGYDPVISHWFWDPASCDGGAGSGGSCTAASWTAGQWYTTGSVVRYPADGRYYVAEHDNPGYDPTISTWYWDPTTCAGNPNPPPPVEPPPPPPAGGLASIVSADLFQRMFPSRNRFYGYDDLVAAARAFPAFATTGSSDVRKREVAAFLANVAHETGELVYIEEIARGEYCSSSAACPCQSGKRYYGRGPIQLSWNFNYCAAGAALGLNLRQDPDLVARDATVAWKTGLWFWMTSTGAGSGTAHNAITGGRGFGETIRTINGAIECNGGSPSSVAARVNYYRRFTSLLGVSTGGNEGC